ncbi:MAG TPA: sodium:solute symporter [Chitinophagaceae bacterium]|nr:sodium:solute symporter [Chitinophagaceae bacterium]
MSQIDWIILFTTLSGIILYGVFQRRSKRSLEGYFLSDRDMPWYVILFSIMGTQASAITYLTGPGQAYTDGMRFVQYYFGLPLAMIVICIFFVPVFSRLKVITAYEFLEKRFDARTRSLTSFLFLISRGLSTGISIYAPSLVLSSLMGWNIYITNMVMGGVLIVYTMTGGARAVAQTQKLQMIIILSTLLLVGYLSVKLLPEGKGFVHALRDAGEAGKLNIISTGMKNGSFDWQDKYNIWSGLIGGFFLALSYFGTDHSQVGRYLTGKSTRESKLGLLMNGLVKVPMQFGILLLGILIFAYYSNHKAPVFFDQAKVEMGLQTASRDSLLAKEQSYQLALHAGSHSDASAFRQQYKEILGRAIPGEDVNDTNYIFLRFVKDHLPVGLIGILFAIIFLSAWGSIAAALNSLAACTVVDFHQRYLAGNKPVDAYRISQWYTLGWGMFCILVSMFAHNIGNSLIEAVNILGSLFYGVILGIFLVAFWIRQVKGKAVFLAALVSECIIIIIYQQNILSFLWLNVIGAVLVLLLGVLFEIIFRVSGNATST